LGDIQLRIGIRGHSMRTLHADLESALLSGYPVTNMDRAAIQCVFHKGINWTGPGSSDYEATYDYSFDPTVTTNRMLDLVWEIRPYGKLEGLSATIILRNEDHAVPDITGYYVDLNFGLNTSSGLKYANTPWPRLWVYSYDSISAQGQKYVQLELVDIWQLMGMTDSNGMPCFPAIFGSAPHFQADDGDLVPGSLFTGLTIWEILDWVKDYLTTVTGYTFDLDAVGDQDDGIISATVPVDAETSESIIYPNRNEAFQTLTSFFADIMQHTNCRLRDVGNSAGDGVLHFKVIYPQEDDPVNEQYSSDGSEGLVFFEAHDKKTLLIPNLVRVYGGEQDDGTFSYDGDDYAEEDFETPPTYNGRLFKMPAYFKGEGLGSDAACTSLAATIRNNAQSQTQSGRITIPFDPRVELFDKVSAKDNR